MEAVGLGDLIQLGVAAPFCWLFWQFEKANRAEREAWRQTHEKVAALLTALLVRSGLTIEGGSDVHPR